MNLTYDICRYIFYGGMAMSGLMLVTSVILFITLRIPHVIGDLTGANARKAIDSIRSQNEESGGKAYKPSAVNQARGKLTDKISRSGKLIRNPSTRIGGHETTKISTMKLHPEDRPADETMVLSAEPASETTLLQPQGGNETTVLQPQGTNETTVLQPQMAAGAYAAPQPEMYSGETMVLSASAAAPVMPTAEAAPVFSVDLDITFIHTYEVIG